MLIPLLLELTVASHQAMKEQLATAAQAGTMLLDQNRQLLRQSHQPDRLQGQLGFAREALLLLEHESQQLRSEKSSTQQQLENMRQRCSQAEHKVQEAERLYAEADTELGAMEIAANKEQRHLAHKVSALSNERSLDVARIEWMELELKERAEALRLMEVLCCCCLVRLVAGSQDDW